jgi:hypothetical protein
MKRTDTEIDSLLKEVGEREAKATPGPYLVVYNGNSLMSIATDYENRAGNENVAMSPLLPYGRRTYFQAHERQSLTFEFLAHSRSDIPSLLSVIAQLRQQNPSPIPPVILRSLRQYRDEHCFDDSEYGVAIDAFLAAPERKTK